VLLDFGSLDLKVFSDKLLVQREKAAQATAQILAVRRKLADWQADLTQAVVASHEEET
jgi:hypothetical protein